MSRAMHIYLTIPSITSLLLSVISAHAFCYTNVLADADTCLSDSNSLTTSTQYDTTGVLWTHPPVYTVFEHSVLEGEYKYDTTDFVYYARLHSVSAYWKPNPSMIEFAESQIIWSIDGSSLTSSPDSGSGYSPIDMRECSAEFQGFWPSYYRQYVGVIYKGHRAILCQSSSGKPGTYESIHGPWITIIFDYSTRKCHIIRCYRGRGMR